MVKVTCQCYWELASRLWRRASGIYTDRRRDDASALTTKVDPKQQPSRDLVDCGLLAALCAIAKRLDEDHACEQGEKRLHRALQALMAQDPARCGAFLFRAASLFDVAVSDAFAARCPDEACVWGLQAGGVSVSAQNGGPADVGLPAAAP